jgi:tripartite-type tricarboxylate transporter receptor subunit TctC
VRLPTEVLVRRLGLNVVAVPYSGSNQYFLGLMTRDVHMGFVSEGALGTFGDKFRVLAVTGATRHAKFPNVPTFAELGFAQIPGITNSLNVRAATPRPIIDRLHAAAMSALRQPAVRTRLAQMQYDILDQSPEEAAKGLADLGKFFAETARQIGLQPE